MAQKLWARIFGAESHDDPQSMDIIGKLPEEISLSILGMLDNRSLMSCALVSKRWLALIRTDSHLKFRVFNRLRKLRWLRQKYGEPKEPSPMREVLISGIERVYSVVEKYRDFRERLTQKRLNSYPKEFLIRGLTTREYFKKILAGSKDFEPSVYPGQPVGVFRQHTFHVEEFSS